MVLLVLCLISYLFLLKDVFSISNDISSLRLDEELPPYKSENEESLGDLFLGFLKYYATNFEWVLQLHCIVLSYCQNKNPFLILTDISVISHSIGLVLLLLPFSFKRSAISIRTGTKLPIEIVKHKVGTPGQWKCLCIEGKSIPFTLNSILKTTNLAVGQQSQ